MIAYETYSGTGPEDFGPGRECEWCSRTLSRYRKAQGSGTSGKQGPLLCDTCVEHYDPLAKIRSEAKTGGRPQGFWASGLAPLRESLGLTQAQMAERVGCGERHYGDLERGDRNVSVKKAEQLARRLGVSVDDVRGSLEGAA